MEWKYDSEQCKDYLQVFQNEFALFLHKEGECRLTMIYADKEYDPDWENFTQDSNNYEAIAIYDITVL